MKKLFYLLLFFSITNTSFATHNMASDISYTHVSGYTYRITVTTYTSVGPGVTADRCELMLYCGDGDSVAIPRVNGPNTLGCASGHDGVIISACTGNIKYNVYETEHTYSGPGDYTIMMVDPNRSAGICNIVNSVNTTLTLQADLNINPFLGDNNAPLYTTTPVNCNAIDVIAYYNPTVTETDGDSLYYELIDPMGASVYALPQASSSFTINNLTGTITWDTPVMLCQYVYDLQIKEYRHLGGAYYYIGSTMQEVWNVVENSTGINEENNNKTSLNVFPNPSNGAINFNIENALTENEYSIIVYNSLGQVLKKMNTKSSFKINENELSDGIYFYSFRNNNKIITTGKFIISAGSAK